MRKQNKGKIFSRPKNQRTALFRTMATSLFLYGKIKTTEAKAKTLRSVAEKMITRARENKLSDKRILAKDLGPNILKKLTDEIAPKYKSKQGGYTRIIKIGPRKSDGSKMVIIELVN